jgi:xanthine dehydrogenase accessory factor
MIVLVRGGGDLASGVILRLFRAGIQVVVTELSQPLAIRRLVSFAEAIYAGETVVEGIAARRVADPEDIEAIKSTLSGGRIPVVPDPTEKAIIDLKPGVLVDARMLKTVVTFPDAPVPLVVGLGPGFVAGSNCHVVIETQRGHTLGRVYWQGAGVPDTGIPDPVMGIARERVLFSPADGVFKPLAEIGDRLVAGQPVAEVSSQMIQAPFDGVLRGILHSGLVVGIGFKVGDIDPRNDPRLCSLVSDKSLAVGGGVLEAILTRKEIRGFLWD